MSALSMDEYEIYRRDNDIRGLRAFVICHSLCTEDGERLEFTAAEQADMADSDCLEPLVERCLVLSGIISDEKASAKNSQGTPSSDSG